MYNTAPLHWLERIFNKLKAGMSLMLGEGAPQGNAVFAPKRRTEDPFIQPGYHAWCTDARGQVADSLSPLAGREPEGGVQQDPPENSAHYSKTKGNL